MGSLVSLFSAPAMLKEYFELLNTIKTIDRRFVDISTLSRIDNINITYMSWRSSDINNDITRDLLFDEFKKFINELKSYQSEMKELIETDKIDAKLKDQDFQEKNEAILTRLLHQMYLILFHYRQTYIDVEFWDSFFDKCKTEL